MIGNRNSLGANKSNIVSRGHQTKQTFSYPRLKVSEILQC